MIMCLISVLLLIDYVGVEPIPDEEFVCQGLAFINVTHRDGFLYCYDNDTVSWRTNFEYTQWKPATIIETRRAMEALK